MKRIFIRLLGLYILISIVGYYGISVSATPVVTVLSAAKDTYVNYNNSKIYDNGTAGEMYNLQVARTSTASDNMYTFIEFDLNSILGNISSANLILNAKGGTYPQTIGVYEVASSYVWPLTPLDNGMNYGNSPLANGTPVGAAIPVATASVVANGDVIIDVSSYVIREYTLGNRRINLCVWMPANGSSYILFNSRESGPAPKLSVNTVTLPTINLVSPYMNSYYNVGDTVPLSASVKNVSGATVSSVVFKLDDVTVAGTTTANGSIYSQDLTNLTIGTHTIKCVATNSDGGVTASPPIIIHIYDSSTIMSKCSAVPTEGAYVTRGTAANYGGSNVFSMMVKNETIDDNDQISFLKFDLNSVTDTIVNATVKLTCSGGQSMPSNANVQAYEVADNTWTSTGISGTNMPSLGTAITNATSTVDYLGDVAYFDITSYVKSQIDANKKVVSIAFFTEAVTNKYVGFVSRYGTTPPNIILTTTKAPVVDITSPIMSSRFNPDESVSLSANITDIDGVIASVEGYLDDKPISLTCVESVYSTTLASLAIGTHTFRVKATDNLGAVTNTINTFSVAFPYDYISSNFTNDTGDPVTTLTSGNSIIGNITVENKDVVDMPVTVVIALYNKNNTLKQINFVTKTVAKGTQSTLSADLIMPNYDLTGYNVMTYLWNDLRSMKPLIQLTKLP